jgi:ribosomal peptide maturation radical SAM protein 1
MYRIALINMPFAAANMPSIALTQLRSVLKRELGAEVACDIHYLNLAFVDYLGLPLFQEISRSVLANTVGLGDWFFSQLAFPAMPDRSELYLARHFVEQRGQLNAIKDYLLGKRRTVGEFLDSLVERLRLADYSLVGFTSMFSQNVACFAMAKALKRRHPQMVIVMGGANCESPMGNVIAKSVPEIDFVFSGSALRTLPRLVRHLLAGEEADCHAIEGVLSRRKLAAAAAYRFEMGEDLDIDAGVALDYDDFIAAFAQKLRGSELTPVVPFETSRGCWWGERAHCTFCGLNAMTMGFRSMAPANAIHLLKDLFARYAAQAADFESVDNILPRRYLTDVLPELDPPAHVELFYEVKADLKEHEIAILKRAHVTKIQPGIEALSTLTLKLMKKGTTAFQNIRFLMNCQRYGIAPYWNLLVGFPAEPESVYRKYCDDLPRLFHLPPPTGVYPIRFDRFSPYHQRAAEYGLKLRASDFYGMIYPFPSDDLDDLAYYFKDETVDAAYVANTARWLGKLRRLVADWQARWQRAGGAPLPELVMKQDAAGSWLVRDSRAATVSEHRLDRWGRQLLGLLSEQRKLPSIAERLPEADVEQQVRMLAERGLLFEEDGAYMSLVLQPVAGARAGVEGAAALAGVPSSAGAPPGAVAGPGR